PAKINRNNEGFISGILVWSIAAGASSYASTYYFELARGAIVIEAKVAFALTRLRRICSLAGSNLRGRSVCNCGAGNE
ncbi:MAG TPA: hypothetical protein VLR90_19000, partial [Blastocatellia bacterium]|nr:hypothetical protein [Blastocatellia bacterium]